MIIAYKHPFVGLFVMSCGTCCFVVSLWPFCFIAVTWPKMANRPNKQPKETRVYRKVVRFIEDLKMKTFLVYTGLVQGSINIFLLLFLFRIAFTIRAVTSSKMANSSKERPDAHFLQFHTPTVIN